MPVHEVDSRLLPPLKDKPGKNNWWEKVGGLPSLVKRVAKHLVHERGYTEGRAYATAISQIRKVCATGRTFGGKTPVKGDTKAMYCKAASEIEAKRAAWKGQKVAEEEMTEDDAASLALAASAKLGVLAEELGPDFIWETIREGGVGAEAKKKLLGEGKAAKEVAEEVAEEVVALNAIVEVFGDADGAVEEAFMIPKLPKLRSQVRANRRTEERRKSSSSSSSGRKRAPKGSPIGGQFIKTGASGTVVTGLQKRLGIKTTGTFGGNTKTAIEKFQKRHGLQVDGVVGRQTATALLSGGKRKVATGKLTTGIKSRLERRFGSSSSSSSSASSSSSRPKPIRSPSEDSLPERKTNRLARKGWDYHDGRWWPPGHRRNKKPGRGRR